MKNLLSLAFLWLAFSNFSQTTKVFHLYYDDIYGQKVGIFPLGPNESTKNCFLFDYDKQGRLKSFTSLSYLEDEGTAMYPNTIRYMYDKEAIYEYKIQGNAQSATSMDDKRLLALINSTENNCQYTKYVLSNNKIQSSIMYGYTISEEDRMNSFEGYKFTHFSPTKIGKDKIHRDGSLVEYEGKTQEVFEIDEKNKLITTTFLNNSGAQVANASGVYTIEQKRNAAGGCVYIKAKNSAGELVNPDYGGYESYYERYAFNKLSDVSSIQNFDVNDQKIIALKTVYDRNGEELEKRLSHFEERREYNIDRQLSAISYYDTAGKPMIDKCLEYHKITSEYNQSGLLTSQRYFGVDNEMMLIPSNEIDPINAGYIYEFDMNGNLVKSCYLTENNTPLVRFGYAYVASEKDFTSNTENIYLFDAENNPTTDLSGAHRYEYVADYESELYISNVYGIDGSTLGVERELTDRDELEGYSETYYLRILQDDDGRMISQRYFDRNHTPKSLYGFHATQIEYNPIAIYSTHIGTQEYNIKKQVWTDEKGLPASNSLAESTTLTETVKTNGSTKITLKRFGLTGELINSKHSACINTIELSDVEDEYFSMYGFNSDGTPFLYDNNEWRTIIQETANTQTISKYSFYDVNKMTTAEATKKYIVAQTIQTSDPITHTITTTHFGKKGKPSVDSYDVHKIIVTMDAMDLNAIGTAYFDMKGKPTMHLEKGYHKSATLYDTENNIIQISFFDVKNKPTTTNFPLEENMQITAACIKYIYEMGEDGVSYWAKTLYYDEKGKLVLER